MVEGKGKGEDFLRGLDSSGRGNLLPLIHIWAKSPMDWRREDHDGLGGWKLYQGNAAPTKGG